MSCDAIIHNQNNRHDNRDNIIIINNVGDINYDVTIGNPLKGFAYMITSKDRERHERQQHNIDDKQQDYNTTTFDYSLEHYYIGFGNICIDYTKDKDNNMQMIWDWTILENILVDCSRRGKHAIIRFYIHYPGKPLSLPSFLLNDGMIPLVPYHSTQHGDGISPIYDDPLLLRILQQFIREFGMRYDGDIRIGYIQCGLLGFWGEWHTFENPNLISEWTKDIVTIWYHQSFSFTKLQIRNGREIAVNPFVTPSNIPSEILDQLVPFLEVYHPVEYERRNLKSNEPDCQDNNNHHITFYVGFHDDSYCHRTLDGKEYNGEDRTIAHYFWRRLLTLEQETFWTQQVMGGEFFPTLQLDVFRRDYPARTPFHQDLMDCIKVTHTTYIKCGKILRKPHHNQNKPPKNNNDITPDMIQKAKYASARMGYNFIVEQIRIKREGSNSRTDNDNNQCTSSSSMVTVEVDIKQIGVAPFYYPLRVVILLWQNKDDDDDHDDDDDDDPQEKTKSNSNRKKNMMKLYIHIVSKRN